MASVFRCQPIIIKESFSGEFISYLEIYYQNKRRHELISDKLYRELFKTIDSHNFKISVCWATTRSELASFLLR